MKKSTWQMAAVTAVLGAGLLWFLPGCDPLPDAAWLRITGFHDKEGSTMSTPSIDVTLDTPPSTSVVYAGLENRSVIVGGEDSVGIDVYHSRVEYSSPDFPVYEYPITLYLAPTHGLSTNSGSSGAVAIPIAPAALKSWIKASRTLPEAGLAVSARVTFKGRTDEGRELVTSGGLMVNFVPEPFSPSARARF